MVFIWRNKQNMNDLTLLLTIICEFVPSGSRGVMVKSLCSTTLMSTHFQLVMKMTTIKQLVCCNIVNLVIRRNLVIKNYSDLPSADPILGRLKVLYKIKHSPVIISVCSKGSINRIFCILKSYCIPNSLSLYR